MSIEEIKKCCIEIDMANLDAGDKSIGTFIGDKFYQFRDLHDVELFYSNMSLKELLKIYSSYNGLECYRVDEPKDYLKSYSLDILSIIELL
jgi:hypothetical protein